MALSYASAGAPARIARPICRISGDYDGDGKTDLMIYRPSIGTWYVSTSSTGFSKGAGYQWGSPTDVPLTGDYDGDGRTDIVVYRPAEGVWFILRSSNNFTKWDSYQFGAPGDRPVVQH